MPNAEFKKKNGVSGTVDRRITQRACHAPPALIATRRPDRVTSYRAVSSFAAPYPVQTHPFDVPCPCFTQLSTFTTRNSAVFILNSAFGIRHSALLFRHLRSGMEKSPAKPPSSR
jgi:hypothetical protein